MLNSSDDASGHVMYLNGVPYTISSTQVHMGGQVQQLFVPLHYQHQHQLHQSPQQDAMPTGYVLTPMSNTAGQTNMAMVQVPSSMQPQQQHPSGPLPSSSMLLMKSASVAAMETASREQTWVPVLTHASHPPVTNVEALPCYRTVLQPTTVASAEALQGVSVISVAPPSMAAGAEGNSGSSGANPTTTLLSDTPLQLLQSASRQRGEHSLRRLSLHQRGTARLFVGQIHYDASEDDLYQIFGVYGHVLDVKIMRSGEAAVAAREGSPLTAPTSAPTATAIVGSEGGNDSTLLNPIKVEKESSRICGPPQAGAMLPPPVVVTSPTSTPGAISVASLEAVAPLLSNNSNNINNNSNPTTTTTTTATADATTVLPLSPAKSNRRCNAFVTFSSMMEADTAISALHGRYVMGRDRPLQVTYCQATENISQFGFAHAVRLHKENRNNPLPFKSGAPTHR